MSALTITPHPITTDGQRVLRGVGVRPGETLAELLQREGVDLSLGDWVVSIGGAVVPRLMWDRTKPKPGQEIVCRRTVGRQVLMIVAIIVIAYFTLGAGLAAGGLGGALGLSGFAAFAVNSLAFMAGSMLVTKLLGPKLQVPNVNSQSVSQTYSVSGGQNRTRPWETLPLLLGQVRVTPDLATDPYQWFEGDDQYQSVRLHGGINCGPITDIQIGDTPINSYEDVEIGTSHVDGGAGGLMDWSNVDAVAGGTLDAPDGIGPWVTRTTSVNTVRIGIDMGAGLYKMRDDGSFESAAVSFDIEYRLLPDGAFASLFDGTQFVSSSSTTPVRKSYLSGRLTAGQYEVRLRKRTTNVSSTRESNTLEWGYLKSYQPDNGDLSGYPQVGIKIRASGQINGALSAVNWLATSKACPVWTGGGWVTQTTSNPGALILLLARGIYDDNGRLAAGMGLPDEQIDVDGLKAFTLHCTEKGYRFDYWLDQATSMQDLLESIAQAGLGSMSMHPGKLSVIWLRDDQPIEDIVNMSNIKRGSFRVDYQTRALAEELAVAWLDRGDWLQHSLRIKAPDVDVPQSTANISPIGVGSEAEAAVRGRFTMAQNLFQRKSVTWEMDLEHLNYRRFTKLALSHDMTAWGSGGRLARAELIGGAVVLTFDEAVKPGPSGLDTYVGLRLPGEDQYRVFEVIPPTAETRQVQLLDAWPAGVALPGSGPDDPAHDTLWIFDFKPTPGQALRIVSIEPSADMKGARITAVPEPDEFWDYVATGVYTPTPLPPALAPLVASDVHLTPVRLGLNYDAQTQIGVSFSVSGPYDHAEVWGAPSGQPLKYLGTTKSRSFDTWWVAAQGSYTAEVRPFTSLGRVGAVAASAVNVDIGVPISAVSGFLTNESVSVAADSTGTVSSFAGAGGTFRVYSGSVDVTTSGDVIFSLVSSTGVTGVSISSTGAYALLGMTADTGSAVFRAVYAGVTIDKVYSISKSRAGSPGGAGSSATLLTLQGTGQAFTFDAAGSASPGSQTLSLTAQLANVSGTAAFTCTLYDATGTSLGTVAMGGSGNTRTLTVAQFGAAQFAIVVATLGALSDQMTLVRLKDGAAGANAVTGFLTNESSTVAADSSGTVSSFTGTGGTFKVYDGIVDKTTSGAVTFSVQSSTGITGMSITATGLYSLTGMTADTGTATLRAVYGSVTVDKVYSISKSRAGAAGAAGSAGSAGAPGPAGAAGAAAVSATLSNDAVVFPADAAGNVSSYSGNSTSIGVFVGSVDDTANWTLSFTASSGVDATRSGATFTVNSISAATPSGYVDITAARSGYSSITKRFSISKSRSGAAGGNGAPGATGATGATGQRGSIEAARAISGASWSDSEAAAAISGAGYGAPVILDQVTLYNSGANYTETRYYNGSGWLTWSALINGNLLVNGSVGAQKLSVSQLSTITATIGLLRTSTTGGRMELESNRIRIFDASNALRVVVGYLL